MGLKSRKILGISVTTSPKKEILEEIEKYLENRITHHASRITKKKKPLVIVTPNPEQIVAAQKDKHFAQILNKADVAIPDGVGLVASMRFLGQSKVHSTQCTVQQRIPGVEFMEDLVGMAAKRGFPVALIGGRGRVAVEALECLSRRTAGGLVGWAEEPGEINLGQLGKLGKFVDGIVEKIRSTGTRLVFVGLGAPKQEYVMDKLREWVMGDEGWGRQNSRDFTRSPVHPFTHPLILMSVGGAFDMIAGRVRRAPWIARSMGIEWLWRLGREPWRFCRQLALIKFIWLVLGEKLA